MITIYTICFNEEIMLPFMIKWYRERFPNCLIIVYDNESTDRSVQIALENNCKVISYSTNNQLSDSKYLEIKNNCWKTATTDWVLVCDVDELLDINENILNTTDYNIIGGKGYEMCGNINDKIEDINQGVYTSGYSKLLCFNSKVVS